MNVIPIEGGTPREVYKFEKIIPLQNAFQWSSDGRFIIFAGQQSGVRERYGIYGLWRVPIEGGQAQELGVKMELPMKT